MNKIPIDILATMRGEYTYNYESVYEKFLDTI
jgi:hypothetical protein